jgi:hypothetical protein
MAAIVSSGKEPWRIVNCRELLAMPPDGLPTRRIRLNVTFIALAIGSFNPECASRILPLHTVLGSGLALTY